VVSINRGSPKMVGLFHGKSIYKWMRTRGTPISGNLLFLGNYGKNHEMRFLYVYMNGKS
jgi:hypothetical protein